ncbi:MAG: UbiA prenyltransferase family protein [Alphaproteobacteria bacterium]|nr:UbiA prenyltransferase family protein [Alphaproteobacteria bacterium]
MSPATKARSTIGGGAAPSRHIGRTAAALLTLTRPWQWIKNGFVAAPVFFAGQILIVGQVWVAVVATLVFTLISAAVYVFNDIHDAADDRDHPLKRGRPIAAGAVTPRQAWILFAGLLSAAGVAMLVSGLGPIFALVAAAYIAVNIAYSIWLKHVALIEMFVVASGYVLRLLAGSAAIGVTASPWILSMTALLALFLVVGKRRADLAQAGDGRAAACRPVLSAYNKSFLDLLLGVAAATTLLSYVLFCVSGYAMTRVGSPYLIATAIFVALGLFRYLQLVVVTETPDAPAELVLQDPMIRTSVVCWVLTYAVLFYL